MTQLDFTAIIVAAGQGQRAGGGLPKQYRPLGGIPVLAHSYRAFARHPGTDQIIVVIDPAFEDHARTACPKATIVAGGDTRNASVAAGLDAVPTGSDRVLIHDGARPCLSQALITRVAEALETNNAAAPALPVTDALWRTDGNFATATLPRDSLARAQTPQGFALSEIRRAQTTAPAGAADDVAVALAGGLDVVMVEGEEDNLKITTLADFDRARRILGLDMDVRTGTGFDVHRFTGGDHVVLCGVALPHTHGLLGHSDADVAMHAITDAIYGAMAAGDIGRHFPPSDPQWKGAASDIFLRHAVELAASNGFTITHLDCTIICEAPKIGPHADAMRASLSNITGLDQGRISIKATTSEGLGFTGRSEGIAAQATATLREALCA